jgi:tripartite-type tricarboxylate transporter receptor subunit TctC
MESSRFDGAWARPATRSERRLRVSRRAWPAALVLGTLLASSPALAQDYPARDIHAICNFPAGSGADVFVRYFSEKLSGLAGKPVIVENKGGALGNIGTEAAARSRPDGYTILVAPGSSTMAAAMSTFKKLPFDPIKDFVPVTTLAKLGFVLVVDPKAPFKSVADLTAHLKAKKEKASYGVAANTGLVSAELYKKYAGLPHVTKVQYREMQTLQNDMFAGSLDFSFADPVFTVEQAKAGRIRPLAVTSGERMSALPDVPTMKEAGLPEFGQLIAWWAVFVPAKTPAPIVSKLEAWFNQIVAMEDTKKFLNNLGSDQFPGNAGMLAQLLANDIKKWHEYVTLANIEPQ